jgi:hypothetical protein
MKINWNHWDDYEDDLMDDNIGLKKFASDKDRVSKKKQDVQRRAARKHKRELENTGEE